MPEATPSTPHFTVLVVDDTPQNLSLVSGLLEDTYNVKLAPSGARALKIVAATPPDLILLDVMMPEIDGYEVCRTLKASTETRDIPVIFLTAMNEIADEEKGLLLGAVDYIAKPISPPILMVRIRNQLLLKEAADKLREQNQLLAQEKERARDLLTRLKSAADKMVEQNRQLKQEQARVREMQSIFGTTQHSPEQLELVWGKVRDFPINELLMDSLYTLALEFERVGRLDKSEAVFRHMAEFNAQFRDISDRLAKAEAKRTQRAEADISLSDSSFVGNEVNSLGRYKIERELGKGAMGTVYLGNDPKIGRVVAIKTLSLSQDFNDEDPAVVKERFFREAESAGRLSHPNIVSVFDVGEERGLAYIAMELLHGDNLGKFTKPGNLLPLEEVLLILANVADALAYAHKHDVVHRDIKPANIVYERSSRTVKVTDFGIASITNRAATEPGKLMGTPSFMSPEQIAGTTLDGRSDLYSLGIMLYQLASGHLPFEGNSLGQLMYNITNQEVIDIRTHNDQLPDCVAQIANTALAKAPENRYQNGEAMARALNLCRRSLMVFGS